MTTYGTTDPRVVGQPISPFFGAQCGQAGAAGGAVALPAGMSILEALSRGILPRNAMVTAINGVSTGAQNPTPVADLCSNGAGAQANGGIAVAGVAGNPVSNGANDQQQFVDGTSAGAQSANGPTPTSIETLTSAPVSVNTFGANVTLGAGQFQG
jgi:hypothetical protein